MVKSLLEMCLNLLNKPCQQTNIDKYWLNCGLRCIPFKFGQSFFIAPVDKDFLKLHF